MTTTNIKPEQLEYYRKSIPLQRIGSVEDVANATYFIATSPFITGTILTVDGGLSLTF